MAFVIRWCLVFTVLHLAAALLPLELEEPGSADDEDVTVMIDELQKKVLDKFFKLMEMSSAHDSTAPRFALEDELDSFSGEMDESLVTELVKPEGDDYVVKPNQDDEFNAAPLYTNLALGRPTWQSSTFPGAPSSLSVDGNKNTSFGAGSCSHTGWSGKKHWWAVDLEHLVQVHGVNLTNRGDCCGYRMNDFVVGLTNNTPNLMPPSIHGYVECGRWKGAAPSGKTLFVKCAAGQAPARYVVIVTHKTYMNLCELEVYGNVLPDTEVSTEASNTAADAKETNLAFGRPTWQSSTSFDGVSERAVDGNYDTLWSGNSCTHTGDSDVMPWWAVDLGQPYYVQSISLVNRGDCCGERLNNFIVGLTNNPPQLKPPTTYGYTFCGQWPGVAPDGRALSVKCEDDLPPSRYVVIMTHRKYLTICELSVFGTAPTVAPQTEIPQNISADQHSDNVKCQDDLNANSLAPILMVVGALSTLFAIVAAMHSVKPKHRYGGKLIPEKRANNQSVSDLIAVQTAKNGAKFSSVWSVSTYVMTDAEADDRQRQTSQESNICNI